ncbi:hypothetical protein ACH4KN_10020 [Streptomyces sp. NPDC017546]|uniref:hypothetical protein n=1 Tax=unclassified Streptomyces TaxID=2593676 RepID=UPI00235E425F|nr:hypothetical protein [Streptomyces sp. MMBL 11-1]
MTYGEEHMGVCAFTRRMVGTGGMILGLVVGAAAVPAHASAGTGVVSGHGGAATLPWGVSHAVSERTAAVSGFLCGLPLPKTLGADRGKVQCVNGWQ